jgi:TatD DNase family protein
MKIIDAHSHIDYITHKQQNCVVGTICCTNDESQWATLTDMIKSDKNIYGAFGVHPWFVNDALDGFEIRLEQLLKNNSDYMVGEIGLDKYKPYMDKQIDIFTKQFDLAVKLKRVVFLHCVGAWDKILHVLKQYKESELPIIVAHAFNGNNDILQKLLQYNNIMFSFNKIDKRGGFYCIEQIPNDRILVESDGKPNSDLVWLVQLITDIKKSVNMSDIIYDNTQRVIKNG